MTGAACPDTTKKIKRSRAQEGKTVSWDQFTFLIKIRDESVKKDAGRPGNRLTRLRSDGK